MARDKGAAPDGSTDTGGARGGGRGRAGDAGRPGLRAGGDDGLGVGEALPARGAGRAVAAAEVSTAKAGHAGTRARGDPGDERGAPGARDAADRGRAGAVRGARGVGEHGEAGAARGRAAGASASDGGPGAPRAALRAGAAERTVAVGHLHVPAAAPRAALRGRVHGRPLAVPGGARGRAPPEVRAGDGGARPGHRRVRGAEGDPHRPGAAVHGVAGDDGVRGGAPSARDPAREEPAAAPADAREDRALLEDAVGGVPVADGVRRLRGLREAAGAVRGRVQLPAAAPGARGARAGGSLLPQRAGGAGGGGAERAGERAAARAGEAAAEALLPRGQAGRPGPLDRRGRGRVAREAG